METVTYHDGLNEAERLQAAALYYEAFKQKLGPILGDRGVEVLANTLSLDRALVARRGRDLVGLAGFEHEGRSLVDVSWPSMRRAYGLIGGAARLSALALFVRTAEPGELLMDGIVVAPDARGQGIGSELLHRVVATAKNLGLRQIRLDVVDTNPGARRLYERHGFTETRTESVPWLRRWFGFGASSVMVKQLVDQPAI